MFLHEREPAYLIERGHLEPVPDLEFEGKPVLASRLGYRITESFVQSFFGRMFNEPASVFSEDMLRPEQQSLEDFVDGVNNIVETQQRVAKQYLKDGSIALACPPLRALIHIMAEGEFEGKDLHHPDIRNLFDREAILASDWYRDRLEKKLEIKLDCLRRHAASLQDFLGKEHYSVEFERMNVRERLDSTLAKLKALEDDPAEYLASIHGTIGAAPELYY
jgi:hypothetical protein